MFDGNQDRDTVVYNRLSPPVTTLFIRVSPREWHNHISMRIEIYGCPGTLKKFKMRLDRFKGSQLEEWEGKGFP